MKIRSLSLFLVLILSLGIFSSCGNETAQGNKLEQDGSTSTQSDTTGTMPDISSWAEASQMTAKMMIDKYGKPNESTEHMLIWYNNGPWKRTVIFSEETKHIFPVDHVDVMEQVIDYQVPANKFSDLAAYDGSVTVRRTDGELSAKCDKEGANFLALNLANDVITGKKSVTQARAFYVTAIKEFALQNKMSPYMGSLQFTVSKGNTGFPDEHGVSEEDNNKITSAMKKMAEKKM